MSRSPARLIVFLKRHRATFVIALVVALASSGTAAAVSYLGLGTINTAGTTTTLKSGVNGAVLQLTNTNATSGINARGLGINVPAGRAPIKVNAAAGKATNLNADRLDDLEGAAFARGQGVSVVSNRRVLSNGTARTPLLELPGLGVLSATCPSDDDKARITWRNSSASEIDVWMINFETGGRLIAFVEPARSPNDWAVAEWSAVYQDGETLHLGTGNDPGPRKTATVTLAVYRSTTGAPCGVQATATIWSTP